MPRDEMGNALDRIRRKKHLLSGILCCGICGGPTAITAKGRYGCSAYRSSRTCSNRRTVPRTDVEERVLSGLKTYFLDADLMDVFLDEYEREFHRTREQQINEQRNRSKRLSQFEREIDRMVDAIANGISTPATNERLLS